MNRRVVVLPLVAILVAFLAPGAWADPPTPMDIVAQLNTGQRVYVDADAAPKLPNAQAINDQILQTGLPMIVVNVAANQTALADAPPQQSTDPFYAALYATHNPLTKDIQVDGNPHRPPLIVLVFDSKNYHAFSYDVSASIAAATGPAMIQAAAAHHGDINGAISDFISRMAGVQVDGPVFDKPDTIPSPPEQPVNYTQPRNHALAWAFLWVLVGLAIVGAIIVISYTMATGRRAKANDRELLQDRINRARKDVDRLAHEVLKGKDVSAEQNSANMSVGVAEEAFKRGDIASARSHVGIAEGDIDAAYAMINPGRHTPRRAEAFARNDVPRKQRRTRAATTRSRARRVTVSNTDYKRRSQSGYRNYYRGGTYDGVPFPAGWYPYCFWTGGSGHNSAPLTSTPGLDYGSWSGGASAPIDYSGGASAPIDYGGGASAPIDYSGGGYVGDSSGGGNAGM